MNSFFIYFHEYWRSQPKTSFWITTAFLAALISVNYTAGIEAPIKSIDAWYWEYITFALFYGAVVAAAWAIQRAAVGRGLRRVLALAVLYFAFKMVHWNLSADRYWVIVLQWPCKLAALFGLLWLSWRMGWLDPEAGFGAALGLTTRGFNARPYFMLLLLLIPIVTIASTQPDFLRVYPKVKTVAFMNGWVWKAVYEFFYGLDFLSIELFFRGLLVISLVRYAGEKAILPMAAFYCTIHFGKPLGECITSFVGGLALGVLAYRTRTVLGGLIVHLGLAWMMELGGWMGALTRS